MIDVFHTIHQVEGEIMNLNFKQIKKSTLSDSIIKQIFEMITQGTYLPVKNCLPRETLPSCLSVSPPQSGSDAFLCALLAEAM